MSRMTIDLTPATVQRGGDPALVLGDLRYVITEAIQAHPRSQQTAVGPSELGTPCARKLGYKLAGVVPSMRADPARSWRSTVGTAVHTWLAAACEAFNTRIGERRFLTETRVTVGGIGEAGYLIDGSCDVYDQATATVVDWKVVGPNSMRTAKRFGIGAKPVYRTQVHLYGKGFVNADLPVDHVAVLYLPSAGELSDAVWACEPFDMGIADSALNRADGIDTAIRLLGRSEGLRQLATYDDYCVSCPFYRPQWEGDLAVACPGHNKTYDTDMILGVRAA